MVLYRCASLSLTWCCIAPGKYAFEGVNEGPERIFPPFFVLLFMICKGILCISLGYYSVIFAHVEHPTEISEATC